MQLGMVGLGRMGGNMAERLRAAGHEVVGYANDGSGDVTSLDDLAKAGVQTRHKAPLLAFGARVVLIGVALSMLQQLVGLNAIAYYGPAILERMGYHMDEAFVGVVVAWSMNLLATMIVLLIVDRVGRKPLLILGALATPAPGQ